MNVVASSVERPELQLRPRSGFPRRLTLWRNSVNLQVCLHPPKGHRHLVFSCGKPPDCRLDLTGDATLGDATLWVDGTAFKLHSDEIPAVREFLTSAGIRILERKPSSTEAA